MCARTSDISAMISFVKIFVKSRHVAIFSRSLLLVWRLLLFLFIVKFVFPGNRENLTSRTCSNHSKTGREREREASERERFIMNYRVRLCRFHFSSRSLSCCCSFPIFQIFSDEVESVSQKKSFYFISGSVIGNIAVWWPDLKIVYLAPSRLAYMRWLKFNLACSLDTPDCSARWWNHTPIRHLMTQHGIRRLETWLSLKLC